MPENVETRSESFARDHLIWIAVRHFLSADLLEELARTVVAVITADRISLDDLFNSTRVTGQPELSSWFMQPRAVNDALSRHVQNVVRYLVWTGDNAPGVDPVDLSPREAAHLADINAAFRAATLDLGEATRSRAVAPPPPSLKVLIDALASLEETTPEDDSAVLDSIFVSVTSHFRSPLDAIVVKHLGDLCAVADRWRFASAAYAHAATLLPEVESGAWSALIRLLRNFTEQSRAASIWVLEGATAASRAYDALIYQGDLATDPVPLLNATIDALNARSAADKKSFPPDTRLLSVLTPQLIDAHDPSHALADWKREKYDGAWRRCWAVLRRQTALGSLSTSRNTKALFGHLVIDHLRTEMNKHHDPQSFWLGVRFLVEGGDADVADRVIWPEQFVAKYVGADVVEKLLDHVQSAPGFVGQRTLVSLTLLKQWMISLPRDESALALTIMVRLAQAARDLAETAEVGTRGADAALKSLSEIAKVRPEFITPAAGAVGVAIVTQVANASIMAAGDAILLAIELIDAFDEQLLVEIADAVLIRLDTFERSMAPWPFVRPAIGFLSLSRILALCTTNSSLRERLPPAVVGFALENESEHSSLPYLLRDLDPLWLAGRIDYAQLAEVILELRKRAYEMNSSRASDDILALLVAPSFSGADGVRDALEALQNIVRSATANRPAISFERAYRPVMLVTEQASDIAREAHLPEEELRNTLNEITTTLVHIWQKAAQTPLIFAGFAIPRPTTPNAILVHNWTFASLGLARRVDREEEMVEAFGVAAQQPLLESAIAVARATRFAAGDVAEKAGGAVPFDLEAIRHEKKEPFYAALGQRLLLLANLASADREEVTTALAKQCLRLGPSGLDAGVFAIAVSQEPVLELPADELRVYRRRLNNIADLRISLAPLLESLTPRSGQGAL